MSRVNVVGGVVVPIRAKRNPWVFQSLVLVGVYVRKVARRARAAFVIWEQKWREQTLRCAEMERIQAREQARLRERLPMAKWYGHY